MCLAVWAWSGHMWEVVMWLLWALMVMQLWTGMQITLEKWRRKHRSCFVIDAPTVTVSCLLKRTCRRLYGQRDRGVAIGCAVTKATRRSKSSAENVKVICIFTFIWSEGADPAALGFFMSKPAATLVTNMHPQTGWWNIMPVFFRGWRSSSRAEACGSCLLLDGWVIKLFKTYQNIKSAISN